MSNYGKYFQTSFSKPASYGVCDRTGFIFNSKDLVKQMVWAGNSKVWTGWMVGKPFIDIPSQAQRPPLILGDPKPVENPRIPHDFEPTPLLPDYKQLIIQLTNTRFN